MGGALSRLDEALSVNEAEDTDNTGESTCTSFADFHFVGEMPRVR